MAWDHDANWSLVPEHIRDGLRRYIEHGVPNGDFLTGVFENDLFTAALHADDINIHRLGDIVRFIAWSAPRGSYGSPEQVDAWVTQKGLEGKP